MPWAADPERRPMQSITSSEGTAIAFERSGKGPPLILVHGTTADHTRWKRLLDYEVGGASCRGLPTPRGDRCSPSLRVKAPRLPLSAVARDRLLYSSTERRPITRVGSGCWTTRSEARHAVGCRPREETDAVHHFE